MRRSATTLVLVTLLAAGLAGCRPDPAERVNRPNGPISVFLSHDATPEQKQAVEERLRGVPDAAEVTFQDREQAYARVKDLARDDPELLDSVRPENLPESFLLTLRDRAAFDRTVDGPLLDELRAMPGVEDVSYPEDGPPPTPPRAAPTTDDCAWGSLKPVPAHGDWREIWVYLSRTITESERQAIEARLRALPDVVTVKLDPRDEPGATPESDGSGSPAPVLPAKQSDSYLVELADQAAANRVADSDLDAELCRLSGVTRVVLPPKMPG
ncbi:permease-like cell division protein FtsX [Plantactinospora sp. WMMC1484]|uniref:permease-like cell division protein FtsX n=1 Tax=Plantactinospora sp. WMMC1484 TaxID=3404122 RepID=UPI003BF49D31